VSQELLDQGVIIDYRPGAGIRMAPHFYNSDEDIERAMDVLEATVSTAPSRTR
jgi:kynureninase